MPDYSWTFADRVDAMRELPLEPEIGWYLVRYSLHTPAVPAMIGIQWHDPDNPDNGFNYVGVIAGCEVDPYEVIACKWHTPISEAEYRYLVADIAYSKTWTPEDPRLEPRRQANLADLPPIRPGEE